MRTKYLNCKIHNVRFSAIKLLIKIVSTQNNILFNFSLKYFRVYDNFT